MIKVNQKAVSVATKFLDRFVVEEITALRIFNTEVAPHAGKKVAKRDHEVSLSVAQNFFVIRWVALRAVKAAGTFIHATKC